MTILDAFDLKQQVAEYNDFLDHQIAKSQEELEFVKGSFDDLNKALVDI